MTRLSLATTAAILAFGAGVALAPVLAQDKAGYGATTSSRSTRRR